MIVIATGGHRTGSTLAYNIVSELCQERGATIVRGSGELNNRVVQHAKTSTEWSVWKSHNYKLIEEHGGIVAIHTKRCPYATAASMRRAMLLDTSAILVRLRWQCYECQAMRRMDNVLMLRYPDSVPTCAPWVRAIAAFLRIRVDVESLVSTVDGGKMKEIADHTRVVSRRWWLQPNHLSDGWRDCRSWMKTIDPELRRMVASEFPKHYCRECVC